MTKLASYLSDNEITQTAFAESIGMSRSYINEILQGTKTPSLAAAYRIEDATGGQVTARSLLHNNGHVDAPVSNQVRPVQKGKRGVQA